MILKSPTMRLSLALVLLLLNLLFLANLLGFLPDKAKGTLELRKGLSESLALQFSTAADQGELQLIQNTLRAVVERNKDIRSAAIRTVDGKLLALAGEHLAHWKPQADGKSTPTHVLVPVYRQGKKWATVEIRFAPLWTSNWLQGFTDSFIGMLLFLGLSSFLCYYFVIKRTLRELDPSAVIPERVQKAFDVLQEGVLILDEKEHILMANKAFAKLFGKSPKALIGLKGSELGWADCHTKKQVAQLPWLKVLLEDEEQKGASLRLLDNFGNEIKLTATAAKVTDNNGNCRGSLVTFDDITQLEEKNFALAELVEQLQLSKEEIQYKSEELEFLANRDPMTLCLNRRSLDRQFEALFTKAKLEGKQLSCMMLDIDLFKSVNDRFGHSTGDQVIKAVADVLRSFTSDIDLVGRYGGEEFCVVLPDQDLENGMKIAERVLQDIEQNACGGVKITVSLGVSSLEQKAIKPEELINQADKALYAAKRSGRNLVISWGDSDSLNTTMALKDNQQKTSIVGEGASQDLLQRRVKELEGLLEKRTREFEHFEMYDIQTGLPTRSLFEDRIAHEIARSKRRDTLVVVLSMTIDTIKRVYESMGYGAAEQLVKSCGSRLNDVLREDIDTVTVLEDEKSKNSISLINQAEFGILLTDIKQIDHVTWVLKRLQSAFDKPFTIKKQEMFVNTFIGISVYPHDGETVEDLYSSAVSACSHVQKLNTKKRYLFATHDINTMAAQQLQIESNLHTAIDNDELQLHFQPLVETTKGRIVKFEALLRWHNDQLGSIPPDSFIQVAEMSGQIDKIGDWVLYHACKQLRSWLDNGIAVESIAVNLSGIQLQQRNLAHRIEKLLQQFNLESHHLEIELTESSLINSSDASFTVLEQFKELGIRITIDDFGTGYSSLAYLRKIPLSCVKIDRSFVMEIGKDKNTETLIASIVSMAHSLGLEIVAEGVEEQFQADHLSALGCEYLQGYLFGKPVPHEEIPALMEREYTIAATG